MHKWSFAAALILGLIFSDISLAQVPGTMNPPTSPPTTAPTTRGGRRGRGPAGPAPSATQPAIQRGTDNRHQQFLERAKQGSIDLLFLGDSITDNWRVRGPRVWDKYFGSLNAANFGIGADRTQNVLFRIENGELEGFKAKCIVLMIGTNNVAPNNSRNTPAQTIEGIKLILDQIRQRQPDAKILLLAVFPRGNSAGDPYRALVKQVNEGISHFDDGQHIFYLDIGNKFLEPDGTLTAEIMPDFLHPSEKGYDIWASAIIDKVKELMGVK